VNKYHFVTYVTRRLGEQFLDSTTINGIHLIGSKEPEKKIVSRQSS